MKKLCIAFTLLAGTISTSTYPNFGALLATCVGAGTAGLSYKLYKETARNNTLGELGKVGRMLSSEMGFGSDLQKFRLDIQNFISRFYSKEKQDFFEVEKKAYIATGIVGALIALLGISSLSSK